MRNRRTPATLDSRRAWLGYAVAAAFHLLLLAGVSRFVAPSPSAEGVARPRVVQVVPAITALEPQEAPATPVVVAPGPDALRARRLELLRRATDAVQAAVAPGARPAAAARADAALRAAEETAQADLEARCAGDDPVTSVGVSADAADDLASAIDALRRLRTRLTLAVDPEPVIAAARREFAGSPPREAATEAEWIALRAAVERSARVFAAYAHGEVGANAFAAAESDLAWVRLRAPGRRGPTEESAKFTQAIEEAGVAAVQALLARGRDGEAVAAAAAFRVAHPISARRSRVDTAEREALARRFKRGDAGADERARLLMLTRPDPSR